MGLSKLIYLSLSTEISIRDCLGELMKTTHMYSGHVYKFCSGYFHKLPRLKTT